MSTISGPRCANTACRTALRAAHVKGATAIAKRTLDKVQDISSDSSHMYCAMLEDIEVDLMMDILRLIDGY